MHTGPLKKADYEERYSMDMTVDIKTCPLAN